jgi:hypothetical protein
MTDSSQLERGYRRMLACYPKAFRRESGEEVLAVLLATAGEGQRRVGLVGAADLMRGAVRMHFGMSRAPRPVRDAVRLMCLGAAVTPAVSATVLVTLGSVGSGAVHDVDFTGGRWHAVVLTLLTLAFAGAPIGAGVWLWLAWANGRGYYWARPAFVVFFGLLTIALLTGFSEGGGPDALTYTWPDLIAATVLWLVGLAAAALIFRGTASPYYQQKPAQQ